MNIHCGTTKAELLEHQAGEKWLTETKLGVLLPLIFGKEFIHNKAVPNSGNSGRPDFRNDDLKLIVEYDGHLHYTDPSVILRDKSKDKAYRDLGYTVVRIPYFVQLYAESLDVFFPRHLQHLTAEAVRLAQEFPNGFISKKCVLPSAFCQMGSVKYETYLRELSAIDENIWYDIHRSLWARYALLQEDCRLIWNEYDRGYKNDWDEMSSYPT